MNQRPLVERNDELDRSHKKAQKTLNMISSTAKVSINKLVEMNNVKYAHIVGPLNASLKFLPPLRSPRTQNEI